VNPFALLNRLLDFEVAFGDLYDWLCSVFPYDNEVSATFRRFAVQKHAHANVIRHERKMAQIAGASNLSVAAGVRDLDRLLDLVKEFRSRDGDPDLSRTIELVLALEKTSAFKLHRSTTIEHHPEWEPFVDRLAKQDLEHVEVLETLRDHLLGIAS
jgi:hypothetical protein